MKKKFKIATLGCRTNQYESQAYRDQLLQMDYEEAQEGEEAELCIVNTCTVTESADSSSRHQIRQIAKQYQPKQLVVTGCLAENKPESLKQIPGVTHLVSNKEKEDLISSVFADIDVPEFAIKNFESHTRAFVKVQDGCNSFCTYCIIPYVRGRSKSRSIPSILKEVTDLVHKGYKEVVITGINVGDFDGGKQENKKDTLADLIRAVDQIPGLERIRVSSIDPDEVDENLANAILEGKKTCPSMHIVLQSGSNAILKKMNRKYSRQAFLETASYLKMRNPDFTFTTDVIVGFPGESEEDFKETLGIIEEIKFAKVHMFPYSERKRTKAALFPNKVADFDIKRRKKDLIEIAEKAAFELRNQFINRTMMVLTEGEESDFPDMICGHTENFLRVYVPKEHLKSNQLVRVLLTQNGPQGLMGISVS